MPMFTHVEWNAKSGRHEFHFVNQQFDLLMAIYYDKATKTYKLSTSEEEAQQIAKEWGKDFDAKYWMAEAEQQLKKADLKKQWDDSVALVMHHEDVKAAVKAAKILSKIADPLHTKQLYALLQDKSFFVREVAAVPLARLEGVRALPALFHALAQGESEGHDNDGITNTIIGVVESGKEEAAPLLLNMLKSKQAGIRADAVWALGFISSKIEPEVFFELFIKDPDPEVRSLAADTLQSYLSRKRKTLTGINVFNGKWMYLDCEPHMQYGFDIQDTQGICIKNNSPTYAVGYVMLKIALCSGNAFVGEQIFTNAFWYPVTARREGQKLHLQGGGFNWVMEAVI